MVTDCERCAQLESDLAAAKAEIARIRALATARVAALIRRIDEAIVLEQRRAENG